MKISQLLVDDITTITRFQVCTFCLLHAPHKIDKYIFKDWQWDMVSVFVTGSVRCRHRLVLADHTGGRTGRGWPRGTRWTSSGHTRRMGARLEWGRAPVNRGQRWVRYFLYIVLFTSKWSFPTLKVNVTLPVFDSSSCSMLSKVEWSRKTSGFCFAELTKSSVSVCDFEKCSRIHFSFSHFTHCIETDKMTFKNRS